MERRYVEKGHEKGIGPGKCSCSTFGRITRKRGKAIYRRKEEKVAAVWKLPDFPESA
jgi:hypothetical protein